jgi:2',3'-cyclic-nucleotide 2'-phosphodiesterase (5'-nucleotidase family)
LLLRVLLTLTLLSGNLAAQDVRLLSILHSNDLHARLLPDATGRGGWAQLSGLARREREGCKHCIYVHAGDLVQGTPVSTLFKGTPLYEISNGFQFDVASLGNHEFDYGHAQVQSFVRAAKYPIVTANVVNEEGVPITGRGYYVKKVNGIRIGFIGAVMTNMVDGFLMPGQVGHWKVLPVLETVDRVVKEIRDKADLMVVVGHILPAEASEIIRRVPGVSVVIEGHNHGGRKELDVHESRVAANCPGYGYELCRLDLEFDRTQSKLISWSWKRIPVRSTELQPDPAMKVVIDRWERKVSDLVDVPLAETGRDWTPPELKALIEQAVREEMQADFSYMNFGGIRDRFKRGTILIRHVWNMLPFDNRMVVATVRGSQVPESLRNGQELDPAREYKIAMADFTATNPVERDRIGLGDIQFQSTEKLFRDVVIEWIRKKAVL